MMRIIGVDPGAISGSYGLFDTVTGEAVVGDLPIVDGQVSASELARLVQEVSVKEAIVERVNAMPNQGVASTWKFAQAFGMILGCLQALRVPIILVRPTVWKRHFRLGAGNKEKSRAECQRRFPNLIGLSRKKDHGRAEGLLLAVWRHETLITHVHEHRPVGSVETRTRGQL